MSAACHLPFEAIEPFDPFAGWFAEAQAAERDANAMALASLDAHGLPNLRIVLLKAVDRRGLVFFTNFNSAKGRELTANPRAAANFHWKALGRQVRLRGPVSVVEEAQADDYFATRPRQAQLGCWASDQSAPIADRAALDAALAAAEHRFGTGPVPRPPHWSGFRLAPVAVEF